VAVNRAQRRLLEKRGRELLTHGIDLRPHVDDAAALGSAFFSILATGRANAPSDAARAMLQCLSKVHNAVTPKEIACRGGCTHCCHLFVSATAPEIFLLARSIDEAAKQRLLATNRQTHPMSIEERLRAIVPCPILDGGLCSAYATRPTSCRSTTSFSAEACEGAIRQGATIEVPFAVPPQQARSTVLTIFRAALRAKGLPIVSYELNAGVVRALEALDAERRWLAGDDVFAGVQIDSASLSMRADDVAALAQRFA